MESWELGSSNNLSQPAGMRQRGKSVGGVQERSNGLGTSLPSPAWLRTSPAQEQPVPNHQRWERTQFASFSSSSSHDLERLRHVGL